jgi:hypothetical protein
MRSRLASVAVLSHRSGMVNTTDPALSGPAVDRLLFGWFVKAQLPGWG